MAHPATYRFSFLNAAGDYLYINSSGAVANQVSPIYLDHAPKNWKNITISYERGWTYYGLIRQNSTAFEFVNDAKTILRWAYYLVGATESKITFKVEYFNNTKAVYDYEDFFTCELDFTSFRDETDYVSIEAIDNDFAAKLVSRESVPYKLEIRNNASRVWVKMDGLKLNNRADFTGIQQPFDGSGVIWDSNPGWVFPTAIFVDLEGKSNGDILVKGNEYIDNVDSQPFSQAPTAGVISLSMGDKWFIMNQSQTTSYDVRLVGTIDLGTDLLGTSGGGSYRYRLRALRAVFNTSPIIQNHSLVDGAFHTTGTTTNNEVIDFDNTITLDPNECLWFMFQEDTTGTVTGPAAYKINSFEMEVRWTNIFPATYVPALRPGTVATELIDNISDNTTSLSSTLLDSTYDDRVIASADAIRGAENSAITLTFADYWESINSRFNASLSYNKSTDTVSIEGKDAVFDDSTVLATLSNVKNLKITPLIQLLGSKLKVGSGPYKYDEVNGKDEFNQITEFLLPMIKSKNEIDLTSIGRADMYGAEYERINYTGKETTDSDSEGDWWFLHIESSTAGTIPAGYDGAGEDYYELYRKPIDLVAGPSYWEISNLEYPETAFNIDFSAKRQLLKWSNYLSSILYTLDAEEIKFQAKTKDNNGTDPMSTSEDSPVVTIDEGANEFVSLYNPPLFLPYIIEFESPDLPDLPSIVDGDPAGVIEFPDEDGNMQEGFIMKVSTIPSEIRTQVYTLIASPNCDLLKLAYR